MKPQLQHSAASSAEGQELTNHKTRASTLTHARILLILSPSARRWCIQLDLRVWSLLLLPRVRHRCLLVSKWLIISFREHELKFAPCKRIRYWRNWLVRGKIVLCISNSRRVWLTWLTNRSIALQPWTSQQWRPSRCNGALENHVRGRRINAFVPYKAIVLLTHAMSSTKEELTHKTMDESCSASSLE